MCFVTAAGVSAALAAVSTGVSVVGALSRGAGADTGAQQQAQALQYQAQMQNYQAQVARNNAVVANQQADAEVKAGQRAAEMQSLQTAARVAKLRGAQAASGVDVTGESAANVVASEAVLGDVDTETALSNAQLRAYGYRSKAQNYLAEAGLHDQQADLYGFGAEGYYESGARSRTASYLDAGGTLLSKASTLPINWLGAGSSGAEDNLSGFARGGGPTGPSGAY